MLGTKESVTNGNLMLHLVLIMVMSNHMFNLLLWILILTVLDLMTTLVLICVWAMIQDSRMTQDACSYLLETLLR